MKESTFYQARTEVLRQIKRELAATFTEAFARCSGEDKTRPAYAALCLVLTGTADALCATRKERDEWLSMFGEEKDE